MTSLRNIFICLIFMLIPVIISCDKGDEDLIRFKVTCTGQYSLIFSIDGDPDFVFDELEGNFYFPEYDLDTLEITATRENQADSLGVVIYRDDVITVDESLDASISSSDSDAVSMSIHIVYTYTEEEETTTTSDDET
ncbi:MAG: hypothetical protein SVZ03_09175 [Spirochaetota bacterium]|nr:hypothetical protein [Spirochaetota bacterium]